MKRTMKIGASITALALLIALLPMQTFAANLNLETRAQAAMLTSEVDPELGDLSNDQVFQDLMLMGDKVGDIETMQIHDVLNDGSLVYEQDFSIDEGTMTYINVWEENGSNFFHYVEGELENTVEFAADGAIYLDGNKVTITTESNENIMPLAVGFESWYSEAPPAGTQDSEYTGSDYTVNSTTKMDFGANFISITIGAMVSILTSGLLTWICVSAGIITSISMIAIAEWLKSSNPYYQHASFKDIRNARAKNNLVNYYKHSVYAWDQRDYTGNKNLLKTYYQVDYPR